MSDIKSQFNEYLQEQSMISMEKLLGEDQKPQQIHNKNEGKKEKGRYSKKEKPDKSYKKEMQMAYVPKGQKTDKADEKKYVPKG